MSNGKVEICMEFIVKNLNGGHFNETLLGARRGYKCQVRLHFCVSFINEAILFNYPAWAPLLLLQVICKKNQLATATLFAPQHVEKYLNIHIYFLE